MGRKDGGPDALERAQIASRIKRATLSRSPHAPLEHEHGHGHALRLGLGLGLGHVPPQALQYPYVVPTPTQRWPLGQVFWPCCMQIVRQWFPAVPADGGAHITPAAQSL